MGVVDINDPTECECGRPKFAGNECCSRCAFLDGERDIDAQVIALLRTTSSWLSENEMRPLLGRKSALWRVLKDMMDSGRIVQQWRETDEVDVMIRCRYGHGPRPGKRRNAGCWEYSLAQKRRAA
jgi:hypothetical protein